LHSFELPIVAGIGSTSQRRCLRNLFASNSTADRRQRAILYSQVFRAAFATLGINFDFVRQLLAFCQAGKPRPFNGADVNKYIISAIIRLDKAKALLAVEPLDGAYRHFLFSKAYLSRDHHAIQIQLVDVFGKEPAGAFQKGTAANRTIKTVLVLAAKRKDLRRRLLNDDVRFGCETTIVRHIVNDFAILAVGTSTS
jgi:hypothetical protein